jgi:DNA invertase Pin-like site-specific DNA recombinase
LEFIKNNGYVIDEKHVYVDLGYSDATDRRPALQRLLEDARKREFDVYSSLQVGLAFQKSQALSEYGP